MQLRFIFIQIPLTMGDRRLKRRSSLGLAGRKDTTAETTPAEVNTPIPFTQATDDEEERRARNIQRRHRHLEAGMSDSPELQRQDSAGRRSVGAGSGGGLSSLTAAQCGGGERGRPLQ